VVSVEIVKIKKENAKEELKLKGFLQNPRLIGIPILNEIERSDKMHKITKEEAREGGGL